MNQQASSTTLMSSSSSPATTSQLTSLTGRLFFDYNGNGIQDGDEPSVQNARLQMRDLASAQVIAEALTDSSGDYKVDIPAGDYKLYINPDMGNSGDLEFRYMCTSVEEYRPITDGYELNVSGPQSFDIGLMEGFLTLPFLKGIPIYVDPEMGDYFFHGPAEPNALWWNGDRLPGPRFHTPAYANPATDFYMPEKTQVKAAAPGRVNSINIQPGTPWWISLTHADGYGTSYIHPEKMTVPVGSFVNRGDTIALSGNTGAGEDNYHTAFQIWRHMSDGDYCIDPYSPVAGVPKGAWIAPLHPGNKALFDGNWQWYPSNEEWISQGYWTKLNDPQYPPSS